MVSSAGLLNANGTYHDVGQVRSGKPQWSKVGTQTDKIPSVAHPDNGHIFFRSFDKTWNLHMPAGGGLAYKVRASGDRPPLEGWTAVDKRSRPTPTIAFEEGFGGFDAPDPVPVVVKKQVRHCHCPPGQQGQC